MSLLALHTPPAPLARRAADLVRAGGTLIPDSLIALVARISVASVFWSSARTKVEDGTWLTLSDSAVYLFREEYRLPLIDPGIAAHLALVTEHVMPVLLVLGLASRFAALVLLGMTLVIEIFVYPDAYAVHGLWAVCQLFVLKYGPGRASLDAVIARITRART
ncbi:DoxX family protein [Prosthecomicrobium sp. N25]|uniref:DoxX family protein n=1 Tax=Prosthecomicrobium sp. N25 TaxID=3129254 RepID=UPI003078A105